MNFCRFLIFQQSVETYVDSDTALRVEVPLPAHPILSPRCFKVELFFRCCFQCERQRYNKHIYPVCQICSSTTAVCFIIQVKGVSNAVLM